MKIYRTLNFELLAFCLCQRIYSYLFGKGFTGFELFNYTFILNLREKEYFKSYVKMSLIGNSIIIF